MAFVYIVMRDIHYEGDEIVGVYSSMISAEIRKKEEEEIDRLNGYCDYTIEKLEVN